MNLLAHSYLSFNHPGILVGNMISDFVKGRKKFDYPADIQKGIMLHRYIDTFTDEHEATRKAKQFLRPAVGLYAGAFVDVVYDHFLAKDEREFSDDSLRQHARSTYDILEAQINDLPERFAGMLPYMRSQNWLYNYRSTKGTASSFGGVVRRASYLTSSEEVFELFLKHYTSLEDCYNAFFPFVKAFALQQFEELTSQ
jgi:acyl carrier protein phosphodiesterase